MKKQVVNKQEEAIINEIKLYSKRFIEKMGGFYPFAISINKNNEVSSIGAYEGNDFPKSRVLIDLLEKSIRSEISNNKILIAAICIDIFLYQTIEGVKKNKNAIEIRFLSDSDNKTEHLIYEITENNNIKFKELIKP